LGTTDRPIAVTDVQRRERLHVLTEISELCSEMRLGQLIANLSGQSDGESAESIWAEEDADLLRAARQQLTQLQNRQAATVA
jgi:hypothetical protein